MNKKEFLDQLRSKLSGLPQDDIEERVSFYSEMIDDRVEDGISEEDAVKDIGPVEEVVDTIMSEIPLSKLVKTKVKPRKNTPGWAIALIIIGFPVWFPLLISIAAVVFSIYITIWSMVIAFYAVDLSLALGGLGSLVGAVMFFMGGKPAAGIVAIGAALVCGALSVLMFIGCGYMVKGVVFLTHKMLLGIKYLFVGKGT